MRYKPNWDEAKKRLTALWYGEPSDRPCISVTSPQPIADPLPVPEPADDEARWLDPDYVVPTALNRIRSTWWGGESLPGFLLMAGWVNCLGGFPRFSQRTIWFDTQDVDFTKPSPFRHDPQNPWTAKYRKLVQAMCKSAGCDDFYVSAGGGLPVNDLLSMLMGTEAFLFALIDHPEWMAKAITEGAKDRMALTKEMRELVCESGQSMSNGKVGFMPFWAPEPFTIMQSDVSCMLSPDMFDAFVLPELEMTAAQEGPMWFHLDGGDARKHLARLLSLPFLRVLQYTPAPSEPPNGPDHLDMYRQVQAAGKIVHIQVPLSAVEPLVRSLDPSQLMLQTSCRNRVEGEQLLEQMVKWTSA